MPRAEINHSVYQCVLQNADKKCVTNLVLNKARFEITNKKYRTKAASGNSNLRSGITNSGSPTL